MCLTITCENSVEHEEVTREIKLTDSIIKALKNKALPRMYEDRRCSKRIFER